MNKGLLSLLLISFISCKNNLDLEIKNEIKKTKIPAVVMGKVSKKGGMQFFSRGPSRWDRNDTINENNIFRIASMTKALGSVAALQLVEQGKITLDTFLLIQQVLDMVLLVLNYLNGMKLKMK